MSVPTPRLNQALEDVGLMSATDSQFPGEPLFGASEQYDYMSPLSVASTNSSVPTPKIVEAVDSLLADQSHQQGLVMRQVHNTSVPINSPKPGCSWYDDSGYNTRGPTTSNKVASKVVRFDLPTVIPHSPPESDLRQLHGSTNMSHELPQLGRLAVEARCNLDPLKARVEEKYRNITDVISETSDILFQWDKETEDGLSSIRCVQGEQIQEINEKYKQLETEYIQRRRDSKESVSQYNIKYTGISEEMMKIRVMFDPCNRISLLKEKTQIERTLSEMMESQHIDLIVPNTVIEPLLTGNICYPRCVYIT